MSISEPQPPLPAAFWTSYGAAEFEAEFEGACRSPELNGYVERADPHP